MRRSTLTAEGFCTIGVISANLRQVLHSPWAGAYQARVEQDQTLIALIALMPQTLRAGAELLARGGLTDHWEPKPPGRGLSEPPHLRSNDEIRV